MKVLNDSKLILNDQGATQTHLNSMRNYSETFRGPLFHRPVTGQELFLDTRYNEPALIVSLDFRKKCIVFI